MDSLVVHYLVIPNRDSGYIGTDDLVPLCMVETGDDPNPDDEQAEVDCLDCLRVLENS